MILWILSYLFPPKIKRLRLRSELSDTLNYQVRINRRGEDYNPLMYHARDKDIVGLADRPHKPEEEYNLHLDHCITCRIAVDAMCSVGKELKRRYDLLL